MNSRYIYEKVNTLVLSLENENTISYQDGRFHTLNAHEGVGKQAPSCFVVGA